MNFKYVFCSLLLLFQTIVPSGTIKRLVLNSNSNARNLVQIELDNAVITMSFEEIVKQSELLHKERGQLLAIGNGFAAAALMAAVGIFYFGDVDQKKLMEGPITLIGWAAFLNYMNAYQKYKASHCFPHIIEKNILGTDIQLRQCWIDAHNEALDKPDLRYSNTVIAKTIIKAMKKID